MRYTAAIGGLAILLGIVAAAPVPKGAKGSWVGKPAFVKSPQVMITTVQPDGREVRRASTTFNSLPVSRVLEDRVEVLYGSGKTVSYFKRQDVMRASEAIEFYSNKLASDPKDNFYLLARAEAYHAEQKTSEADADYTRAMENEPKDYNLRMKRAAFRMDTKQFEKAIQDYDEIGKQSASYQEWSIQRKAEAKAGLKKFDEAIADLTKLLATTTNRTSVLLSRGLLYSRIGSHQNALDDYEEILKADPNYAVAVNNKAWLRCTCPDEKFRDGQEAVKLATKACELTNWQNAGYIDTLAAAYAEVGDFENAIKRQEEVLNDAALLQREGPELKARLELYKKKKPYRLPDERKK